MYINNKNNSGQVMLVTVLFLASVFLVATAVAGVLTLNQTRQTNIAVDSMRAIYAADAALERGLFKVFRCNNLNAPDQAIIVGTDVCLESGNSQYDNSFTGKLTDNQTYELLISKIAGCPFAAAHDDSTLPDELTCIKSVGRAGSAARAFTIGF
ncbi:MAG: hypothetical protein EXS49_02535 [Candidatus Pacebacteria bacterium]|nr:hypothetical protein [Candidatus Paceibacterota bacterium]